MRCPTHCLRETVSQHPASPGVIADDERLSRAGYGPTTHYKKGKVTAQIVRKTDILNGGTLSLWRTPAGNEALLDIAENKLRANTPAGQWLYDHFIPTDRDFRAIVLPDGKRGFSVVDDCETGSGPDPMHCGLKVCDHIGPLTDEDERYIILKTALWKLFKSNPRDTHTPSTP